MTNQEKIQLIKEFVSDSYNENEYPALNYQSKLFAKHKPLQCLHVLDCTPVFKNTLLKYIPLLESDCNLQIGISDIVPRDNSIINFLKNIDIPVIETKDAKHLDIILDCNGSASNESATDMIYGVCELTRSGIYQYQDKNYPIILVDDSKIKEIETIIGTGDGYIRGMKKLHMNDFRNSNILLFGFGKVGRGVVYYLKNEGAASVNIIDKDDVIEKYRNSNKDYWFNAIDEVKYLDLSNYDHIITATGIKGSMKRYCDEFDFVNSIISNKIRVSNISIENEWHGTSMPKDYLINNGNAVNFVCDEPTRLRYIDPTMALSNHCAVDLYARKYKNGIHKPDFISEQLYISKVKAANLINKELEDFGFLDYFDEMKKK